MQTRELKMDRQPILLSTAQRMESYTQNLQTARNRAPGNRLLLKASDSNSFRLLPSPQDASKYV
jgi:hypothetical protein